MISGRLHDPPETPLRWLRSEEQLTVMRGGLSVGPGRSGNGAKVSEPARCNQWGRQKSPSPELDYRAKFCHQFACQVAALPEAFRHPAN
jgi:hypothetical protein